MCRIVGYLGESIALRALIDDPPHGLERQSWAPREMQGGVVNADGWGCAWYLADDVAPCVYRSGLPIWADANRLSLGRALTSHCFLAAVRSATDPLSHCLSNTQPFIYGPLSFLHNGYVKPFRESVLRGLRRDLCDEAYRSVRGDSDSEHYFALVIDEWLRAEGEADRARLALERASRRLLELTARAGGVALIAAALGQGAPDDPDGPAAVVVQRAAHGGEPPSLYIRAGGATGPGVVVASEPLDHLPGWMPIEPGRARSLSPGGPWSIG